jgi:hypothetical protein
MRSILVLAGLLSMSSLAAAQESQFGAELRVEGESIRKDCGGLDTILACATTLATDQPIHVAFGSLAPQNGFAFGVALVGHKTPNENWRLTWSGDVVGAFGGGWRAGAYMQLIHTAVAAPVVITGGGSPQPAPTTVPQYPVINIYAQMISLPTVSFYGLGPESLRSGQTFFGTRQTIVGTNAIIPVNRTRGLNLSLLGEVNGRFTSVRAAPGEDVPSIEQLYNDATAPGLSAQPGYLQFGEAIRIRPTLLDGHLRLSYLAQLQQFIAPSDSTYSFGRWTVDLAHEIPIYRNSSFPGPRDFNGPNSCGTDPSNPRCPQVTRNRTGTVGFRFLASQAMLSDGSVVPFYFQQTLGGSDINGNRALPSYDDYRFRATRLILFQESVEHSLFDWPVGVWLGVDEGKVLDGTDLGFLHSVGVGLTLRAGGFPVVNLTWATGGTEGHHTAFTISTSLLGGSARPPLQ